MAGSGDATFQWMTLLRGRPTMLRSHHPHLNVAEVQGRKSRGSGRQGDPLARKDSGPCQDRGSIKDVQRDGRHSTILRSFQECATYPFVERRHGRPAPDLVVDGPGWLSCIGPVRRLPEIPAEDEGHLVLRIALPALDLAGVALSEIVSRLRPDYF